MRISEFIIDETLIKADSDYLWLWIAIEPRDTTILDIYISIERNTLVPDILFQEQ